MSPLCDSIEMTAMVYLDDELAPQERHELELHLVACGGCRGHVERERAELDGLRQRLGQGLMPPPPSELLVTRVSRGLDAIDAELVASGSQTALAEAVDDAPVVPASRWRRWALPGAAALAAAAALLVFVALPPAAPAEEHDTVAHEAVRQELRGAPLEVQGASTGPWLERHFQPGMVLPRFPEDRVRLVGARLTSLAGQPAAQLVYEVGTPGQSAQLMAFVLDGVRRSSLPTGRQVVVDGRVLRVLDAYGAVAVAYVDAVSRAYVFTSKQLTETGLLEVVVASNLIADARVRVR